MLTAPIKHREEITSLIGKVRELEDENANLRLKIRALEMVQARPVKQDDERQQHFEIKYTQSVSAEEEVSGQGEAEQQAQDTQEDGTPSIPSSTTKRKSKKRISAEVKFESLPISKETVLIPEEVRANPEAWKEIEGETTYEVLVHPTTLSRHKIVRKKFVRVSERQSAPIISKAPIRFSASYVSNSLAIYILLNKYLEHGSLNRLEKKFARLGADISRQSQSDTVERFSMWVRPLYELIEKKAKASDYLQIDDVARQRGDGFSPEGVRNAGALWAA